MDTKSKEDRSLNMSKIHSKDTKPEMIVRKYLFSKGYRYRLNQKNLPGKPDIVMKKYNTIIFINGCFWHMHENCKYAKIPLSNIEYWEEKLRRNSERDKKNIELLQEQGWNVYIIWECELKKEKQSETLNKLVEFLSLRDKFM
ncbi:very short patch repair endonuclease [Acetobacterium wieringae]|uniref:very short patch repair endonuclease n=1 Tax=Acetobacterium wieringae TaxID=52694 RepID=UPI002033C749|nr:DNA mismatch endonuclease Vsr [Acetobacterium wieringae]URN83920.1 DNA mismatch endonuclease Vsr [Acetobacterium wieringae]